jgi:6-pyruvoyltetrahydropterin/6-carboxytetrahydropterin synthase
MLITATRRLQYAIGHRVHRHESKCRHLHGHNFVFRLTAEGEANELDDLGRVIDFGVLKRIFDPWFLKHWDHGFVLYDKDAEAIEAVRSVAGQKLFLLPFNPTAENLAQYVLVVLGPKLLRDFTPPVRLRRVVVYETENGIAEAAL